MVAVPVKEIADAIQRTDVKWLTTLPGVGGATAEQIIATLRRKVTRYALMAEPAPAADGQLSETHVVDGNVLEDAYQALCSVGLSPLDARNKLDAVLATGKSFKSVEDVLTEIYTRTVSDGNWFSRDPQGSAGRRPRLPLRVAIFADSHEDQSWPAKPSFNKNPMNHRSATPRCGRAGCAK